MAKKAQYSVVDSKESFEALLTRVRQAQQEFARYSQERVDAIFKAAAMAANQAYSANVTAFNVLKQVAAKGLEIGK